MALFVGSVVQWTFARVFVVGVVGPGDFGPSLVPAYFGLELVPRFLEYDPPVVLAPGSPSKASLFGNINSSSSLVKAGLGSLAN